MGCENKIPNQLDAVRDAMPRRFPNAKLVKGMLQSCFDWSFGRTILSAVKATLTILLTLLLAGAPAVFTPSAIAPFVTASADCACPACPKASCCACQAAPPASAPSPVAPAPASSQQQTQLLAAIGPALLVLPVRNARDLLPAPFSSLRLASVPLYTWNCAYLI
jgi:hypothetical protein